MHYCATVHGAITSLTNLEHYASDNQHIEFGQSRLARDGKDLSRLIEWFRSNSPFSCTDGRLHSLSTGLVARDEDNINCDAAEAVGARIQLKLDKVAFNTIVMKKADRATTLREITGKLISVPGSSKLPVHSTVLFSRLLVIIQREPNISSLFKYELAAVPTALFNGESLRKTVKSQLAKTLTENVENSCSVPGSTVVVDGGWLLHKVKWQLGLRYVDVVDQYIAFVSKRFGLSAVIVFDGYETGPSIKDHEHSRRAAKSSPDIVFDCNIPAYKNQGAFLSNSRNKAQFVAFLITSLQIKGYTVYQAKDDADTLIVEKALEFAHTNDVTVVANDTDILVLLVYHFKSSFKRVLLHSEVSTRKSSRTTVLSIRDIWCAMGESAARQLLVVHAISGCDTTSCLYGHSKGSVWRRIISNNKTLPLTDIIQSSDHSHESIAAAGLKLLTFVYSGKFKDSLNNLRYTRYMDITASATAPLKPERLPPTENAAKFHIFRTHLQVLQWKSLMNADINPTDWGWKLMDGHYVPIATDLEPAPETMLSVMRCKCKIESKHPCSSQHCTCAKNGLQCVAACKNCKGCECENPSIACTILDEEDCEEVSDNPVDQLIGINEEMSDDGMEFAIPWVFEEEV